MQSSCAAWSAPERLAVVGWSLCDLMPFSSAARGTPRPVRAAPSRAGPARSPSRHRAQPNAAVYERLLAAPWELDRSHHRHSRAQRALARRRCEVRARRWTWVLETSMLRTSSSEERGRSRRWRSPEGCRRSSTRTASRRCTDSPASSQAASSGRIATSITSAIRSIQTTGLWTKSSTPPRGARSRS